MAKKKEKKVARVVGSKVTPRPRATASTSGRALRRTVLAMPWDRKERAVAVLFQSGYEAWEVAALLRKSEGMVLNILRKYLK